MPHKLWAVVTDVIPSTPPRLHKIGEAEIETENLFLRAWFGETFRQTISDD